MGYSGYYRFFFSIYFVLNFCILFCNLFGLHFTVCIVNEKVIEQHNQSNYAEEKYQNLHLQPLLRNRENWKTGNILVLLNPSQNNLMVIFSVFLSRLRDPKCAVSLLYMETRPSQVF